MPPNATGLIGGRSLRAVDRAVLDAEAGARFAEESATQPLNRLLHETYGTNLVRVTEIAVSQRSWHYGYWAAAMYSRSKTARTLAINAADRYLGDLKRLLQKVQPEARAALQSEIDAVEASYRILVSAGRSPAATSSLTALGRLEESALLAAKQGSPEAVALAQGFRRWRNAICSYSLDDVNKAARELDAAISKYVTRSRRTSEGLARPSQYRKTVAGHLALFNRSLPREASFKLFTSLTRTILDEKDAALTSLWQTQFRAAVAQNPHTWERLANVLEGLGTDGEWTAEVRQGAIERVKGVLAEMVSVGHPEYRAAYAAAVRRADAITTSLNEAATGAKKVWRVVMPQADLTATALHGNGLRLFFDDTILVVNNETRDAYVVFAAQVKAGDASSREAISQLVSDQTRLLHGRIAIGGTAYNLKPPASFAGITRVFVGTKLPTNLAADTVANVRFVKAPVDQEQLHRLADLLIPKL